MKTRLKSINNPEAMTMWCGPAAISIITGNRVEWAASKLAKIKYDKCRPKMVRGVSNFEMRYVLDRMGYECIRLHDHDCKGMTLGKWIDSYSSKHHRAVILVNVTEHYVVANLGHVADNHKPNGCPVGEHPARRKIIKCAWIVKRRRTS